MTDHGTDLAYRKGCRCDDCRAHNTQRLAAFRAWRKGEIPHATDDGYVNWACRCELCREAHRDARRADRDAKNVSPTDDTKRGIHVTPG